MKSPILYFFLLILSVLYNLALDAVYKYDRFSKPLSKKGIKFILDKKVDLVIFF